MSIQPPPAALHGSVVALWELRGRATGIYSGLPKPYVEFVISLSGRHYWRPEADAAPLLFEDGWLTPLQAAPRFAQTVGALHLVGVRLHPAAAARLFGPAEKNGPGYPIPIDALLGAQAGALRQSLIDAGSAERRFERLACWFLRRLDVTAPIWLPDASALGRLGWRVDALADTLGLSSRGLRKRFDRDMGIGPKLWLQLGRFDAVLKHRPQPGSLAQVSVDHGYFDQAHFNSEFRRFAGLSPGAYWRSRVQAATPLDAPHFVDGQAECRYLQSAGDVLG